MGSKRYSSEFFTTARNWHLIAISTIGSAEAIISPDIWNRVYCHSRLLKLVTHLEQHLSEPMTLAQAADVACMQRTAFSRFFRRVVGMRFRDFLHAFRITRAIPSMTNSDYSITEIAATVGYSDISTFERSFKQLTRMSPREYRKTVWKSTA